MTARLFLRAAKKDAEDLFSRLENQLDTEEIVLSINELHDHPDSLHEVSVYLPGGRNNVDCHAAAIAGELGSHLSWEWESLPDIDWVQHSLQHLQPVRLGRLIVHGSHDREKVRPADIAINIDAAMAFGTGHHATTCGCLQMAREVLKKRKFSNALDIGTGSAILAIALAKLARLPVTATDIDPVSIDIARGNIRKNSVERLVDLFVADGLDHPAIRISAPFDMIIANILANPLIAMAPAISRHAAKNGILVLSGILENQKRRVIAAFVTVGFRLVRTTTISGWVTLQMEKR